MIVGIEQKPMGWSFEDWQDCLQESTNVADPVTVGNYRRDLLTEEEEHYLDLEAERCGLQFLPVGGLVRDVGVPPPHLQIARGVGNWRDPKVVVVCERIECQCKGGGGPRWQMFSSFRRLRPFSGSERGRKFLYRLLSHASLRPSDVYVTATKKDWMITERAGELLKEEMMTFLQKGTNKVIALGPEAGEEYRRWVHLDCPVLYHPEFWTGWHKPAWEQYRDEFKRLVTT